MNAMTQPTDIDLDLRHMTPSVRASFRLTSERHTLDHLLDELGVAGARCWQRGETEGDTLQRRSHGWCVDLPEQRTYSLDDALSQLLAVLAPHRDDIVATIRSLELDAHFGLHVQVAGDRVPACYWSPVNIRTVALYEASLEADIAVSPVA
ncbi:hypothetical protein BJI69_12670 [Luteibacter rhizovicinus DSM 16549]|uniref:Uncharacterized protein n=1 Tax=Luteibacter rhizovicinus DSM 16549 TaxID=1440763 RepID=A0A0G9HG78_9GAMM|nr:DUF4279 domain-containing protein [Luteibacter rhizovicinus]APG04668.1 hypothetical protein BJI69_12670 [Luteibacter rhizovicinus DSM 16549]KLD68159.1 hypothetical protein Y883_03405 [Luteibacter rhizovicinus DSM 16549]KLD74401.1 hypothetical protein Y886_32800 [Xanthomonas hyacinthi DSM 19077]